MSSARRIVLARRPSGAPVEQDFVIEAVDPAPPADGELLLRTRWISIDPMIAIITARSPLGGAIPPLPVGAAIPGAAVSDVIESRHPDFAPGDRVEGRTGWRDVAVVPAETVRKVDASIGMSALGALGLPGFTAWAGLTLVDPIEGRTLLVSAASGAVGVVVGQLAKLRGAKVIGLTSSAGKAGMLERDFGFDAAVAARPEEVSAALGDAAVDIYFDNVGGELSVQVVAALKRHATVLVCGVMSGYAEQTPTSMDAGALLTAIMGKGLRVIGFNNRDFLDRFDAFEAELLPLVRSGRLRERFNVERGLEGAIRHAGAMLAFDGVGKRVAEL